MMIFSDMIGMKINWLELGIEVLPTLRHTSLCVGVWVCMHVCVKGKERELTVRVR
jgi:hypothetical protein